MTGPLSTDARHCALRVELARLDLVKLRVTVLARLHRLADREAFAAACPEGCSHERLVAEGARALVRAELLASYQRAATVTAEGDRISGVRAVPLARIRLVKVASAAG